MGVVFDCACVLFRRQGGQMAAAAAAPRESVLRMASDHGERRTTDDQTIRRRQTDRQTDVSARSGSHEDDEIRTVPNESGHAAMLFKRQAVGLSERLGFTATAPPIQN